MKEVTHEWAMNVLRPAQKTELTKRSQSMQKIPLLKNNPDLRFDLLADRGKQITKQMVDDGWYDRFMQTNGFNVSCELSKHGQVLFKHLDN